jgi:hypothetical protein
MAVDVRMIVEWYGPSYLDIRTGWHCYCTPLQLWQEEKEGCILLERSPMGRVPTMQQTGARAHVGAAASRARPTR